MTCGLRQGQAAAATADGSRAAVDYEDRKNQHLHTLSTCTGFPIFASGCGSLLWGWGPTATKTWKELAAATAARSNESVAIETDRLLQSLAIALQRENARAVLRRFGG